MPVFAKPRNLFTRFKFLVEIDGFTSAGFQSCSELSGEFAEISYFEGGATTPEKIPGRQSFADITLVRGATQDREMYNWFRQIGNAAANAGIVDPDFRKNGDIIQQDRTGNAVRRWRFYNAWCKKFVAGQWDNNSDDISMESIVIAYDYFELVQ
jgi:phage tail-like protein